MCHKIVMSCHFTSAMHLSKKKYIGGGIASIYHLHLSIDANANTDTSSDDTEVQANQKDAIDVHELQRN